MYPVCRFPKDIKTYGIDKQFLWGKSLLVTPVLDPGMDYVEGYFPEGLWYDYYTVRPTANIQPRTHTDYRDLNRLLTGCGHMCSSASKGEAVRSKGEELRLDAPLDKINLHLREGSVTPTQVNLIYCCCSFPELFLISSPTGPLTLDNFGPQKLTNVTKMWFKKRSF